MTQMLWFSFQLLLLLSVPALSSVAEEFAEGLTKGDSDSQSFLRNRGERYTWDSGPNRLRTRIEQENKIVATPFHDKVSWNDAEESDLRWMEEPEGTREERRGHRALVRRRHPRYGSVQSFRESVRQNTRHKNPNPKQMPNIPNGVSEINMSPPLFTEELDDDDGKKKKKKNGSANANEDSETEPQTINSIVNGNNSSAKRIRPTPNVFSRFIYTNDQRYKFYSRPIPPRMIPVYTFSPTFSPTAAASESPSDPPTGIPSGLPTTPPTGGPTGGPTQLPTTLPVQTPVSLPANLPIATPGVPTNPPVSVPVAAPDLETNPVPEPNVPNLPAPAPVAAPAPTTDVPAPTTDLPSGAPTTQQTNTPEPTPTPTSTTSTAVTTGPTEEDSQATVVPDSTEAPDSDTTATAIPTQSPMPTTTSTIEPFTNDVVYPDFAPIDPNETIGSNATSVPENYYFGSPSPSDAPTPTTTETSLPVPTAVPNDNDDAASSSSAPPSSSANQDESSSGPTTTSGEVADAMSDESLAPTISPEPTVSPTSRGTTFYPTFGDTLSPTLWEG